MNDNAPDPSSPPSRSELLLGAAVVLVIVAALAVVAYRLRNADTPPSGGARPGFSDVRPSIASTSSDGRSRESSVRHTSVRSGTAAGPRVLVLADSVAVESPSQWIPYTGWAHDLVGFEPVFPRSPTGRPMTMPKSTSALKFLDPWLAENPHAAPIILWNFGLQDAQRMNAPTDPCAVPLEVFADNLRLIGRRLLATGARVYWISATPVGERPVLLMAHDDEPMRNVYFLNADVREYNAAAAGVMDELGIPVIDLHAFSLNEIGTGQLRDAVGWTHEGSRLQAEFIAARLNADLALDPLPAASAQGRPETQPPVDGTHSE